MLWQLPEIASETDLASTIVDVEIRERDAASDRETWQLERRRGIGGSDAATVVGVNPWRGRYELWLDKVGRLAETKQNEAMRWGHALEPAILDELASRRIVSPRRWPQTAIVVSSASERDEAGGPSATRLAFPWLRCTPDALAWGGERGLGVVQVKTVSAESGRGVDDELDAPLAWWVQVQHELAATGAAWGVLAVLVGGQSLKVWTIERDESFLDELLAVEREFWELVETRTPPIGDSTELQARALAKIDDNGRSIILPSEAIEIDLALAAIDAEIAKLERARDELRDSMRVLIGENAAGILPNGAASYSFAKVNRKGYYVEPSTFRALRREARSTTRGGSFFLNDKRRGKGRGRGTR